MIKRILTLVITFGSLSLAACSSEPSDLRPEKKVSLDAVPPGTRSTPNLDNAANNSGHDQQDDAMLNHDPGANQMEVNTTVPKKEKANDADSVENHE
ncbi:MAG: hypothetical protein JWQ14_2661 [Adhaeribacter sp.]|nr:hypothetical protein [Adhaeribacter sp.]